MPSKIRVLDEQTINVIAAGEVIENPSSVVKELVDNALDAGANEICVEIRGGARQLIRISDNGCGMNKDDALLCLERHATSKIRQVDDLASIYTMGFRGEAMPSIASISKFTLITCPAGAKETEGTVVSVDGGKIMQCASIVRSPGTTIEVKSLFFNVPVRRKFQKSPAYDANEILKVVSAMALANPMIKFELINDQKPVLDAFFKKGEGFQEALKQRVEEILGKEFSSSTCFIAFSHGDYKFEGLVGEPHYTRHNRTGQYLFINKRPVVSSLISYAVREGYGTSLPANRHPVYVLHLTMPGNLVDVNVHPQKKEVRLRQEQILRDLLMQAVRNHLQKPLQQILQQTFKEPPVSFIFEKKAEFFKQNFPEKMPNMHCTQPASIPPRMDFGAKEPIFKEVEKAPELFEFSHANSSNPRVLATMKHYVLIESFCDDRCQETFDGLCLMDQKAAHSRIIFEKLIAHNKQETWPQQALLIPYTFEASAADAAAIVEQIKSFNRLGIGIRQAGPQVFIIESLPPVFGNVDMDAFINQIIHSLGEYNQECEKQFALAASRSSISNNRKLTVEEAQGLVRQLMLCQSPYKCPQGKPTLICITYAELAKRFQK